MAAVGTVQTLQLVLSLRVTSNLFCLKHFKGKFWMVEREGFASPAVLCNLCDWEGSGFPSFHPCRGWEVLGKLNTMEELVLGRNTQDAQCSASA